MRFARRILLGTLPAILHCGVDAEGVDACRAIEERKCEQLLGCPGVALASEDDVTACKLFYRDQCLNGVVDGGAPSDSELASCLAAIDQAGACHDASLVSCADAPTLAEGADPSITGCEAVLKTETLFGCSFLATPATAPR